MAQIIIPRILRNPNVNMVHSEEAYSGPCETSKMERLRNNGFKSLTIFAKQSILNLRQNSRYSSAVLQQKNIKLSRIFCWVWNFETTTLVLTLLRLVSTKRSCILKQICSWKLQVCLIVYDLLVNTRRWTVNTFFMKLFRCQGTVISLRNIIKTSHKPSWYFWGIGKLDLTLHSKQGTC